MVLGSNEEFYLLNCEGLIDPPWVIILVLQKIKSHFKPGRLFYVSLHGSMTDPPSSTMAPSEAANSTGTTQQVHTTSSDPPVTSANKNFVMREFDLVFCMFFLTPPQPAKFHPIPAMTQLFCTILKDEPSLVLQTPTNNKQIILMLTLLPTGESEFKTFFKVTTICLEWQNKTQVCIGCHILSNCSLSNSKHDSPNGNLLAWMKQEHIFF